MSEITTPAWTAVMVTAINDENINDGSFPGIVLADSEDDYLTVKVMTPAADWVREDIPSLDNCAKDAESKPSETYWTNVNHPIHRPPQL